MSKGNLLLGTSTGSIGDVTLSRRNGRQIQRVRVRTIANPKSESQGAQRMRMAAITRFYSPLATCLEKAFEGKNRSQSYSKFLSINAKKAAADNFAVPKDGSFAPIPVQISAGTLPTPVVSYNAGAQDGFTLAVNAAEAPATFGDFSKSLIAQYGLQNGDQVTIVAVFAEDDKGNFSVEYHRFFLDTSSAAAMPSAGRVLTTGVVNGVNIYDDNDNLVSVGVVFSRWQDGKWRRSNTVMVCSSQAYYGDAAYHQFIGDWTATIANAPVGTVYLDGNGNEEHVTMFRYKTTSPYVGDSVEITSLGYATVPGAGEGAEPVQNVLVGFDTYGVAHPYVISDNRSDNFGKSLAQDGTVVSVNVNSAITLSAYDRSSKQAYDEMFRWWISQGVAPDVAVAAISYYF